MADNSILTPGYQDNIEDPIKTPELEQYLLKDNFLSEYSTEEEKSVVRENLSIPSKDSVYSKTDTDIQISEKIRSVVQEHLNAEDPHGILPTVEGMITDMVKTDGSTPFILPQTGVDPQTDYHLATKKYIDNIIKNHLNQNDPHEILPEVLDILTQYIQKSEVYTKSDVYNKNEIDNSQKSFIKRDGTTPFIKAQIGVDPQIDSHLSTKRYVDKVIYEHIVDVDPHNFITTLNNRLSYYIKKKDVFDKTQTYSRSQIDSIINKAVNDVIELYISDYKQQVEDKFEYIRKQNYVKQDGSTPFRNPQSGVQAIEDQHLTTLGQVNQLISILNNTLHTEIQNKECTWKTSGPIESTVGHFEDNTEVPETMTFQEVCDAVFYGKAISIHVPDYVTIGQQGDITVCVRGSAGLISYAELYQEDKLIYTFQSEDFENGCVTVNSLPIYEDTEFTFRVYYTNNAIHEVSDIVKCSLPVFVGLLPKWKSGNTITMDYLIQLQTEDVNGTQNRFLDYGNDLQSITFYYEFTDTSLRHPFIVLPENYPDLKSITTSSQNFGIEAFDVIDMIPLEIKGIDQEIIFKIYIYKQALSSLSQDITFNFK